MEAPTSVDSKTRYALAEKMAKNTRHFPMPPEGFKPLHASPADLRHYGIPRCPNKETHPLYHAKWQEILSRPLRVIQPELVAVKGSTRRPPRPDPHTGSLNTNASGWPWSGAVLPHPAGEFIDSVSATWIVPNASPPPSAWNGTNWNDGNWQCAAWVGIDGAGDAQNDVVQAGTTSEVTVKNGVITQDAFVWYEWYPASAVGIRNFVVKPGDTLTCTICMPSDSTSHAVVTMINLTSNLSVLLGFDAPTTASNTQGHLAEWIVEDATDNNTGKNYPFPNYGTTFFYDCAAATKQHNLNLTGTVVWDAIPPGTTAALSIAQVISPTVLKVQTPPNPNAGFRIVNPNA